MPPSLISPSLLIYLYISFSSFFLKSVIPFHTIKRNSFTREIRERRSERMKVITIVGILLTAVGVISLIYQGLPFTTREKIVEFGPLQAYKEEKKKIPVPPVIGVLAIGGGILLIVAGVRKK
jgi:hypothetical protein